MMIVGYFDWFGTPEQLEEYVSVVKKAYDKTPGTKFLGKFAAANRMYHWAFFLEVKDWHTFQEVGKNLNYKRDLKTLPHFEYEFFP